MQLKLIQLFIIITTTISTLSAQLTIDALRISSPTVNGTGRFMGVSGAMGALGGDYSAICVNPGGIGVFRKSDFAFSGIITSSTQSATLKDESIQNSNFETIKNKFNFGGAGFVIGGSPTASNWERVNFVLAFNQSAQFGVNTNFAGVSSGSILDRFLERSLDPNGVELDGLQPDQLDGFEAGLAYETGAIYDPITTDSKTTYIHDLLPLKTYKTSKAHSLKESGNMYNFNIGLGGNYKEKLFIGGNLNFPIYSHSSVKTHEETAPSGTNLSPFSKLKYSETTNQEGGGVNIAVGAIFKPAKTLRLGLAYQSPGYISITESYLNTLTYSYVENNAITTNTATSPDGLFEYAVITPQFVTGSIAYVSKFGFLSADVQFKDYNQSKFLLTVNSDSPADATYQNILNADIDKQFKPVWSTNLGAEAALAKFRLRAGTKISQSEFANDDKLKISYSAGAGYRGNKVYFDLGFSKRVEDGNYLPYLTGNSDFNNDGKIDAIQPLVSTNLNQYQLLMTLGFKF